MSIHAELEALLRDLPPVSLAMLNQAREKAFANPSGGTRDTLLKTVQDTSGANPDLNHFQDVLEAQTNPPSATGKEYLDNIRCLKESVASELPPRLACDAEWQSKMGADATKIGKFTVAYDTWEAAFEATVQKLVVAQETIKTKKNVAVPLSFRLEVKDGSYIDVIYIREEDWNALFGKLMATTKISKMTLWAIVWLLDDARPGTPSSFDSVAEIGQLIGRSIEVRTDPALSALKVVYDPDFPKLSKQDFDVTNCDVADKGGKVLEMSLKYGNPIYISNLVQKKLPIVSITEDILTNGYFLAMQDENHELFDYLMTQDNAKLAAAVNNAKFNFLFQVALNCVRSRNNDSFIFKLVFATGKKWAEVCKDQNVELKTNFPDHFRMLVNVDQRITLRNPLVDALSAGDTNDREKFLERVGRTGSKGKGP